MICLFGSIYSISFWYIHLLELCGSRRNIVTFYIIFRVPSFIFRNKINKVLTNFTWTISFRCSLLLFKSAVKLMFLYVMESNLASSHTFESSILTSTASLLKLPFCGTIGDYPWFTDCARVYFYVFCFHYEFRLSFRIIHMVQIILSNAGFYIILHTFYFYFFCKAGFPAERLLPLFLFSVLR